VAPVASSPAKSVDAPCRTTGVQETHITYAREVTHCWHPWYGQTVWVHHKARRGGSAFLRCVRDERNWSVSLEIPECMVDVGFGCGMESLAYVSSSAWLPLREFLTAGMDHIEPCVVQAQHLSSDDADNVPIQSPPWRAIYSTGATVAATAGGLSVHAALVGPDDERASGERSLYYCVFALSWRHSLEPN
jgi:hypothetical protein